MSLSNTKVTIYRYNSDITKIKKKYLKNNIYIYFRYKKYF